MTESSTVDIDLLYSGQYHEVNPGQYHEVHPGQYHEVNPGQYQEDVFTKPVSSKYPSKGQYRNHEDSYSEEYEVNNVKVDFDHQDNHKTYTVEAKAGDFIIGEVRPDINFFCVKLAFDCSLSRVTLYPILLLQVGRIDVNNGQTLEVCLPKFVTIKSLGWTEIYRLAA